MEKDRRITLSKLISYILSIAEDVDSNTEVEYKTISDKINEFVENPKLETLKVEQKDNLLKISNKIKEILDIFLKNMYRVGIDGRSDNYNISLLYSVLYCLSDDFYNLDADDKLTFILEVRKKMLKDINSENLFEKFGYNDFNWLKKELNDSITNFKNNKIMLRFIVDYFNINIFILNTDEDRIYCVYSDDKYNMFKNSIILCLHSDIFEPVEYENNKILTRLTAPLKKLVNVDKNMIHPIKPEKPENPDNTNEEFNVGFENLDRYFSNDDTEKVDNDFKEISDNDELIVNEDETEKEVIPESTKDNKDNKDIFYKSIKKISEDELKLIENSKVLLSRLQEIAEKYSIDITYKDEKTGKTKKKTKGDLVEELKNL